MSKQHGAARERGARGALAATALGLLAAGSGAAALDSSPARANAAVQDYRIPAGPVAAALNRLADASGAELVYDSRLTRDVKTRGLSGRRTLEDALGALLAGTGLAYRLAPDGKEVAIMLARNEGATQSDAGAVALPTVDVAAPAAEGGGGEGDGGPGGPHDPATYSVPNAVTATKTDTPIMQTPVSVQIVPQQVLQDQQVVRIEEALQNVSGVYTIGFAGLQNAFSIRGFRTQEYYVDGVRVSSTAVVSGARDLADIQQIEVLKGPASILYGRLEPGGLVNLVRKQPQNAPYYDVQQQFGSFRFYRTTMDATGPATPDGALLYRLDGAYENAGSFRDLVRNDRVFLAPRLLWAPTEDTRANFYLEYSHSRDPAAFGLPILNNFVAPVPISRNFSEASLVTTDDLRVGFNWSHAFDPNWTLNQKFDADFRSQSELDPQVVPLNPDSANCSVVSCPLQRFLTTIPYQKAQDYYASLELTGHFDTFGLAHTLLIGGDYYLNNEPFAAAFTFADVPSIDLFHPVHSGNLAFLAARPDFANSGTLGEDWYGAYLQDQIALPYNIHLLAGFRYDNAGQHQTTVTTIPELSVTRFGFRDQAVKPRLGLLWRPIPQLSLYGSYVENFGLTNGLGAGNAPLPPSEARQWEVGIKADLLNSRLSATAAWFDIIKTNVASLSTDPAQAAQGIQVATGAVRNTGFEFDLQGQLTPEWKTIGSFAYINSKIVKDAGVDFSRLDPNGNPAITLGNTGNRFFGVPALGGSLWAVYEPQFEPFKGLSLGAGFVARGNAEVDNANTFALPSYAVVNLMAGYKLTVAGVKMTAQINVNNLFDKIYFLASSFSAQGIQPGAPRTILGSLKVEF